MDIVDHFKGKFFTAEGLDEKPRHLTIKAVEKEVVGHDDKQEEKPVVHVEEDDQKLTLNRTRALAFAEVLGRDSDKWTGHTFKLRRGKCLFGNKYVACMVVDVDPPF